MCMCVMDRAVADVCAMVSGKTEEREEMNATLTAEVERFRTALASEKDRLKEVRACVRACVVWLSVHTANFLWSVQHPPPPTK